MEIQPPSPSEYAPYYRGYVAKVDQGDLFESLKNQLNSFPELLNNIPQEKWNDRYQPEKWSIREVVLHVLDSEMVFLYRILRIARGDQTPLPGFDQDLIANAYASDRRTQAQLISGFIAQRETTLNLMEAFDESTFLLRGMASNVEFSVRALAFIIAGHLEHHKTVIQERYLV